MPVWDCRFQGNDCLCELIEQKILCLSVWGYLYVPRAWFLEIQYLAFFKIWLLYMCNWGTLGICTLLEMKRWWVFCLGFFICLGRFSWFPLSCFCDWQPEIPPPVVRATSPHSSCHQFLLLLFHFLLLLQRGRAIPLLLVAGYCPWRPGTANKAFSLHLVVGISNLMEPCFRFSLEEMKQEMAFSPCPLPQRHPVHQLMRWYYAWETRFVGVCVCVVCLFFFSTLSFSPDICMLCQSFHLFLLKVWIIRMFRGFLI